jgi:hypothetical protein
MCTGTSEAAGPGGDTQTPQHRPNLFFLIARLCALLSALPSSPSSPPSPLPISPSSRFHTTSSPFPFSSHLFSSFPHLPPTSESSSTKSTTAPPCHSAASPAVPSLRPPVPSFFPPRHPVPLRSTRTRRRKAPSPTSFRRWEEMHSYRCVFPFPLPVVSPVFVVFPLPGC